MKWNFQRLPRRDKSDMRGWLPVRNGSYLCGKSGVDVVNARRLLKVVDSAGLFRGTVVPPFLPA
jgi:hypothetical protein